MASGRGWHRWMWLWAACYVAMVGAIVWSMFAARRWALAELATPKSTAHWQAWRNDVKEQEQHLGPVERRVPKSVEPPALVLMRDYFGISLTGAILFTTVLFWVIVWFVTGATSATWS